MVLLFVLALRWYYLEDLGTQQMHHHESGSASNILQARGGAYWRGFEGLGKLGLREPSPLGRSMYGYVCRYYQERRWRTTFPYDIIRIGQLIQLKRGSGRC